MYRRTTIPNEAHLTAFEILEITTQQYHKTKGGLAAMGVVTANGHGKIKTEKPASRKRVAAPTKAARARKKA